MHGGRVLGVVEGDEHLLVVRFGGVDELGLVERVGVLDGVIRRDVAHDFRVQPLPQRVAEHLHVLVADAGEEARGRGVRAGGPAGAPAASGRQEQRGERGAASCG